MTSARAALARAAAPRSIEAIASTTAAEVSAAQRRGNHRFVRHREPPLGHAHRIFRH